MAYNKGPRQMSERDVEEHSWVDVWLQSQPAESKQWTSNDWKQRFFKMSTSLSYILRHGAENQGLKIRTDGYIAVETLLNHKQFSTFAYTMEEVKIAVEKNAKQRFALKREGDVWLICAQQGHSAKVGNIDQQALNTTLDIASVPELVIHGTYWSLLPAILKEGLKKMERDHIHMAAGMPDDGGVKSGIRQESDTVLRINARQAIIDGIEFLRSGNGVILTEGRGGVLPPAYIECVMDRSGRICPRPADLAESVKWPVPRSGQGRPSPKPPPQQSAPVQSGYKPVVQVQSQLTQSEKDFLKVIKKARAIIKMKEDKAAGIVLDNLKEQKLAKLDEALTEVAEAEKTLSTDSDLRDKNKDVLAHL